MDTQFTVIQPPAQLLLTPARRLGRWLCFGALLLLAALLGQPTPAHAQSTIITVDADAPGPVYDGLSWATAFTTCLLYTSRCV